VTIAEVEVDKETEHVQVKRVVCAQDMVLAINPEVGTIPAANSNGNIKLTKESKG
jgi:hypothetical protein